MIHFTIISEHFFNVLYMSYIYAWVIFANFNILNWYTFQKQVDCNEFAVHPTEFCPRNQMEWNKRSLAINCSEDNGYVCLPNDDLTVLLELCFESPHILIQEGR